MTTSISAGLPLSALPEAPPLNPLSLNGTRLPASEPVTRTPPPAANASLAMPAPMRKKKVVMNVLLCLVNGERIPVESFDEQDAAKQRARDMTQELHATSEWYQVGTRFIRPDAVVSIDLEAAIAR